jgi:hypothetical protein
MVYEMKYICQAALRYWEEEKDLGFLCIEIFYPNKKTISSQYEQCLRCPHGKPHEKIPISDAKRYDTWVCSSIGYNCSCKPIPFEMKMTEAIKKGGEKEMKEKPDYVTEEHLEFLNALRETGITNMFGASPYLEKEFSLDRKTARNILTYWMSTFVEKE